MLLLKNCQCFLLVKQRILGVLKLSKLYHEDIGRRKSLMDSALVEEWMREVNAEFKAKERKIALKVH